MDEKPVETKTTLPEATSAGPGGTKPEPAAIEPTVVESAVAAPVEAETIANDAPPPGELVHVTPEGEYEYPRFRLMARIEHMLLLISFTILCLTGLPQKFPYSLLSQWIIDAIGGIEFVRMIHRWAAVVLILGSVYHLLTSSYRLFVKHERMRMLPDVKDALDLRDTVAYNLGFDDKPPRMRKFNFGEKFEYWAVVWGTAVMIITGFILWNPIAVTRYLPGELIPVSLEAHGWEAVLAAASIVIWHLYNVLVKHRNMSMFTGTISHKVMEEEHVIELERLERGGDPWRVISPDILARRRRVYFAVAGVVTLLALALVVWMFTFEDTAITTVPQATQEVFVPLATATP
jgi:formate dehydrogenase gamma subunit